jgi:hypothetical protein
MTNRGNRDPASHFRFDVATVFRHNDAYVFKLPDRSRR